ncbi:MAG TPA: aldo/keto reductase [Solirubrobacteraceae bacterium]|nr:aldo/keto reductase [Solirubrobacteraceae bacterium]
MPAPLKIQARPLAGSSVLLPRVALGCGGFGGVGSAPELFGQGLSDEQAAELMDAAWEMGITHFDTADAYGGGRSERAIGAWIASRGLRPTLTTKTFHPMRPGGDFGLEGERVMRCAADSLRRLGVDRVELYLAHEVDPSVPLKRTVQAFERLRDRGMIAAWGLSNVGADALRDALAVATPAAVQNGCSLLERGDLHTVIELCARHGVAYSAFSPLCGGWLAGRYRRGEPPAPGSRMTLRPQPYLALQRAATFDALERLEELAAARGDTMASLAIAWLLADERISQIVVGPARPEHLEPVRRALEHPLQAAERDRLTELFAGCGL